MSVERFTAKKFEDALKEAFPTKGQVRYLGLVKGEHCFFVVCDTKVGVYIRSSVKRSGVSAETGEDSIRMMLVHDWQCDPYELYRNTMGKADTYTTRTKGWERRMADKIKMLIDWRRVAGDCPKCKKPLKIATVRKETPNKGRKFATCFDCNTGFVWLTDAR